MAMIRQADEDTISPLNFNVSLSQFGVALSQFGAHFVDPVLNTVKAGINAVETSIHVSEPGINAGEPGINVSEPGINVSETCIDGVQTHVHVGNPLGQLAKSDGCPYRRHKYSEADPADRPERCQFKDRHGRLPDNKSTEQ